MSEEYCACHVLGESLCLAACLRRGSESETEKLLELA